MNNGTPNCWVWDVDPIIIAIYGPIQVRWYGLCFLACFVLGFYLLNWQMTRAGRSPQIADDFVNWGVIGSLAGAWFGHRFFYEWDRVVENPFYLIDLSRGLAGLASHGATIGLFLACFIFARRKNIPFGEMTDRFTFATCMGFIFVRLGNLFNSEILGRQTDAAWAVCFPRVDQPLIARHPTQVYEVATGIFLFALLYAIDRAMGQEKRPRWVLTAVWLITYFPLRFAVEFLKEHQTLADTSTLTMGQYLSIPGFFIGVALLVYALRKRLPASGDIPDITDS